MGSFVEDLWSSIFTPGATPTLLVATNVTFAALQLLLFILLISAFSIHFFILSFLSGALWWSINWFANELKQTQIAASEKEQRPEAEEPGEPEDKLKSVGAMRPPGTIDTSESDTETETFQREKRAKASVSTALHPPSENKEVRKRPSFGAESSGYGSTDSEWEKVDSSNNS